MRCRLDANNTDEPQTLQQITLTIVNNTQCADFYARFSAAARDPIIIGDTQLCAQGTTNRDACQGLAISISVPACGKEVDYAQKTLISSVLLAVCFQVIQVVR